MIELKNENGFCRSERWLDIKSGETPAYESLTPGETIDIKVNICAKEENKNIESLEVYTRTCRLGFLSLYGQAIFIRCDNNVYTLYQTNYDSNSIDQWEYASYQLSKEILQEIALSNYCTIDLGTNNFGTVGFRAGNLVFFSQIMLDLLNNENKFPEAQVSLEKAERSQEIKKAFQWIVWILLFLAFLALYFYTTK